MIGKAKVDVVFSSVVAAAAVISKKPRV